MYFQKGLQNVVSAINRRGNYRIVLEYKQPDKTQHEEIITNSTQKQWCTLGNNI